MKSWILGMALLLAAPKPAKTDPTLDKAAKLLSAMKHDEAEALVRGAIRKNPAAHGYHLALGRVLAAKGRHADAYLELHYEGLRAGSEPSGPEAFKLADGIAQMRGPETEDARAVEDAISATDDDPLRAIRLLEGISKERRSHYVVRFYLAEAKLRTLDPEPALKDLRGLSAEDPHFVPSVVLEALALRMLGKDKEAAARAARARKMAPSHGALKALAKLEEPLPSPLPTPIRPPPVTPPNAVP